MRFPRFAQRLALCFGLAATTTSATCDDKPQHQQTVETTNPPHKKAAAEQDNKKAEVPKPFKPRPVVFWGDSVANGMGKNIKGSFETVENRGVDGAGLLNGKEPKSHLNLPKNAVVIIHMMGNDMGTLRQRNQEFTDDYAERLVKIALDMQAQGATPIIIGHHSVPGPYTGGGPGWQVPGVVEKWNEAMHRTNAAVEKEAQKHGIVFSSTEGRVSERHSDNLHYTRKGYRHITHNALKDAGIPTSQLVKKKQKAPTIWP
ncbi:MAG: SGNH/GDSL hydrolase family protein [Alphaproteobacteria bacterium]|nr:SGNH/GDSL hydrolase family protein [Alphaproteobacteria bacterium]